MRAGDIVKQIIGDGTCMVVKGANESRVTCTWIDYENKRHEETFNRSDLVITQI